MSKTVLVLDVGSTTTKAILFQGENELRLVSCVGAPTTVEKPHEDVLVGVLNAVRILEEKTGRKMLAGNQLIIPVRDGSGVDNVAATSSAGGGLQMLVAGVIKTMTAESAHKAALGAGAVVTEVLSIDDGKTDLEKVETVQRLRPDMILLSGGIDNGNLDHVLSMAELIAVANPESRLDENFVLPVVYAGNKAAAPQIDSLFADCAQVHHVENLRRVLEEENLEPAAEKIQEIFLEHVMSHAPGYSKLLDMMGDKIMPTPNAVGEIVHKLGERSDINILAVDIGGATTDVFSSMVLAEQKRDTSYMHLNQNILNLDPLEMDIRRRYHRSVDANLGMSYSVGNVLAEAGGKNIVRWLPFPMEEKELRDILSNKMIHPTILPQTVAALWIEHAVAREAIKLAFNRHKSIASGLKGVQIRRGLAEVLDQDSKSGTLIKDIEVDVIIGSGGVLSHAPNRLQALAIMVDAFEPVGITEFYVDSVFMMPHLGVMSSHLGENVLPSLQKDCLIPLGTVISPEGPARKEGQKIADVKADFPSGETKHFEIVTGKVSRIELPAGETAILEITPAYKFNVGDGPGKRVRSLVSGGEGGIVLDGRSRPLTMPADPQQRAAKLKEYLSELGAYPAEFWEVEKWQ